uniref:Uncharacterized protein n=1 Tax=Populus trichocarpa TaxID=3694 RepID=A0A2K1YTZ3_POPTR
MEKDTQNRNLDLKTIQVLKFLFNPPPPPQQYPVGENGFEFQQSLVEALYGLNIWDRLRALINVLKILSEQNSSSTSG